VSHYIQEQIAKAGTATEDYINPLYLEEYKKLTVHLSEEKKEEVLERRRKRPVEEELDFTPPVSPIHKEPDFMEPPPTKLQAFRAGSLLPIRVVR